tara:strand:+ start:1165 stop:1350 length:186 start_codon:yes stop_codon:yes gene_type:complete
MSASDNKMITAIAKMYPKLKKSQITNFVKKRKKKPVTVASVTKVKVGIIPVKKKKKTKKKT